MTVFSCKACGKPIVFITTVAGKKMPCDAMMRAYEPDADGPDTIITKDGQTVRGRVLAHASGGGNLGHATIADDGMPDTDPCDINKNFWVGVKRTAAKNAAANFGSRR